VEIASRSPARHPDIALYSAGAAADSAGPGGPKLGTVVMVAHTLGADAVPAGLEGAGFEVVVATGAEVAMLAALSGQADIAVVDGRFDGDGLAWCERLWSERPGFPVLLIGPNDENLVTKALSSGADDYLLLPLRPAELVARVRAVLRRAPAGPAPHNHEDEVVEVGDVRLSVESHEVTVRSQRVHLPLREFELLRLLMENAGIVLARTTLMTRLWGPSVPAESTSLEVHIRRLRSKLEEDPAAPRRIVTVRGIGYRYQAEH
jgi:two-component system, OmpR family, response regulator RegX3